MDSPKRGRRQKKTLNCIDGAIDSRTRDVHELGRRIYNARCYFCHGYSGNAATAAARYLVPKPRDFTTAVELTAAAIAASVRLGRTGTAMKSFRDVLVEEDIRTVARFVEMEFVRCGSKNTRYHTAANGWPDHETRNAPAIPFVGGELSVDIADDDMTGIQRQGLAIFRQGCVICHEGRMTSAFPSLSLSRLGQPATSVDNGTVVVGMNHTVQHGEDHHDVDEYADNTVAPRIDNLTPQQQLGEVFYQRACVQCHARDGSGQHWVGRFLRPSPADFNDPALLNRYDDAALAQLISQGRPKSSMPAFWGILSADQSAAIIAYMRRAFAGMK